MKSLPVPALPAVLAGQPTLKVIFVGELDESCDGYPPSALASVKRPPSPVPLLLPPLELPLLPPLEPPLLPPLEPPLEPPLLPPLEAPLLLPLLPPELASSPSGTGATGRAAAASAPATRQASARPWDTKSRP